MPESLFFFKKVAGLRASLIKREALTQVFSCEFCKIFKNTFFTEHLWATASDISTLAYQKQLLHTLFYLLLNYQKQSLYF